jgi:hypothetical protein
MAITQLLKQSKSDVFAAGAPDAARTPKLRGKRQMLTFSLPPELVAAVDAMAEQERRSRANMIEVMLERVVSRQNERRRRG